MDELEALESSVSEAEADHGAAAETEISAEAVISTEAVISAEEAEALRAVYPQFDAEEALAHPVMGPILRGEAAPSLRQVYEAVHWEEIAASRTEAAIAEAVSEAVAAAVAEAVKDSEERLLGNIRARGQRPAENGTASWAGARLPSAVLRLTRRERAMLAKRAENGEHIHF